MKILVTGGAGFIGSVVVKNLIKNGHQVVIFDNLSTGSKELINKQAIFSKGDLLNMKDLDKLFKKYKFDAVMHFAAFSLVGESVKNPSKYFRNNIVGSLNLFDKMIGHNVKRLVFSSTAAIFGSPSEIPITEKSAQVPTNPYGISKLTVENILNNYDNAYGLRSICLRYFNAAGASENFGEMHNPETHLIPNILKMAKNKKGVVKIFGNDYNTKDGTCVRDYIHVEDLSSAHLLALDYLIKNKKTEKFNLGSEKGYSVFEIVEKCKKITGVNIKARITKRRNGDPDILIASSKKIKEELKWKPEKKLEDIISDAWRWELKC